MKMELLSPLLSDSPFLSSKVLLFSRFSNLIVKCTKWNHACWGPRKLSILNSFLVFPRPVNFAVVAQSSVGYLSESSAWGSDPVWLWRTGECSRVIGSRQSPRSSVYRDVCAQASTSRLSEPTPLTVYRAVTRSHHHFAVVCDYTNAHYITYNLTLTTPPITRRITDI